MHAFKYHRPSSVDAAAALVKGEAKLLAGGQSLVQAMKLRLSSPSDIIDLGTIKDLAGIKSDGKNVTIGAMARHAEVAHSADVKKAIPALAAMAEMIGELSTSHTYVWGGDPGREVAERPTDEMLAKREPSPPKEPVETVKLPDNVLASLRVQGLDAATMSQLNIPAKMTGVVVTSVEGGGPAEAAGVQRGDVIQEVNHQVVTKLEDYQKASSALKKDEMAVLLLSRQGNNLFVAVNPQ